MNKKKVLPGLVALTAAAALASCSQKVKDPYAVEINKPMMILDENPNDEFFVWAPVEGADGYLVKIDDGEEKGIGNPVHVNEDGFNVCYYVINVDDLEEGEHKVQFAAYSKDKVSEWTDLQKLIVKREVKTKLARPVLESGLIFTAEEDIDKVEFDFGSGIKVNADIKDLKYENYGHSIRIVGDPEELGIADKLKYGNVYTVTVRTSRKGESSEVSNPISYTFTNKFYNKVDVPTILFEEVVFAEELSYPSLTVKLNDKEYSIVINQYNCASVSIDTIIGILLEKELVEVTDLYEKDEFSIAVKVNFDNSHYKGGDYSNTYSVVSAVVDEDMAQFVFDSFNYSINKNEIKADVLVSYLSDFVSISAKIDDNDVNLVSLEAIKESQIHKVATAKYEMGAKEVTFTVTYKRNNFTQSKEFKVSLSNTADIKINNLKVNGSVLNWNVIGNEEILDAKYIVEIKNGDNTQSIATSTTHLDLKDVKVSGDFTVTVYAVYNNAKIDGSASLELSLNRRYVDSTIYISSGRYEVPQNYQLIAYDKNGNSQKYCGNDTFTLQNLVNYSRLELIALGDGITCLDSLPSVFVISNVDVTDLVYTIEDAKYLVLRDYKPSEILSSSYSKYIITDKNDIEKFDLAAYNDATSQAIVVGKPNFELSSSKENNLVIGSLPLYYFNFAPRVEITSEQNEGNTSVYWQASSRYYGNYEVIVEKLDEKTSKYVKVDELSNESTSSTYLNMVRAAEGSYRIQLRTLGHGDVLAGEYTTITYYANSNDIEIDKAVVENNYTNVYFKNDFNLTYQYSWNYNDSYSTMYNEYLRLNNDSINRVYLKSVNYTNGYVRYLPTKSFEIEEINTETGSVKKIGNVTPDIPYGMLSYSTIAAPYLDKTGEEEQWKYAKQAGSYVVEIVSKEDQQVENITKEFVLVEIQLGSISVATEYYVGSYTSYRPSYVVVEKNQPLLAQIENAVHLDVNASALKALKWHTVTPSTDSENPDPVEELLSAETLAVENMTLKLKKDESFKTYAYSLTLAGGDSSAMELKVYADGRVTMGDLTLYDVIIEDNKFIYQNAIYELDEQNQKYGPWLPEGLGEGTRYTCQPELLENIKEMYKSVCETYGEDSDDAKEAKLFVELLENVVFVEYEEYVVVLLKNESGEINTATYLYNNSKSITHEGLTWTFIEDTNCFVLSY